MGSTRVQLKEKTLEPKMSFDKVLGDTGYT